jgi:hypothetical protein
MKQCLVFLITLMLFTASVYAAPGDVLTDQNNAVWLIASNKIGAVGITDILIDRMETMPNAYQALGTMNKFITWLEVEIVYNFNKVFPAVVYQIYLGKFIGYEYDLPRLAPEFAPPTNIVVDGTTVTCDDDPTGVARDVKLWKLLTGKFTEQAVGTLSAGTWTWTGLTAGTYVVAYDDNFESLPSLQFP